MRVEELAAAQAVDVDLAGRRVAGVEVGCGFGDATGPARPREASSSGHAGIFLEGKRGAPSGTSKCATWPSAWTPESVRPDAVDANLRLEISPSKNLPKRPGPCAAGCRPREAPAPATLRRTSPDTPARAAASRRRLWPRPARPRAIVGAMAAAPPRRSSSPRSSAACRASRRSRGSPARSCA